jgi:GT2 family glycosyltransferase
VVALTDDDTRPPADWLATALSAFEADPDLACLEGPVYGGCRSFGPRHYVGCNLAVRRTAALDVGGFRSAYSEWREDVEFGWRMEAEADGNCRFEPSFRMCHPEVPRTAFDPDLERRLKREYPDRYEEVMEATVIRRCYRRARAAGLTQPLQRVRNEIGRRLWGECRGAPGVE